MKPINLSATFKSLSEKLLLLSFVLIFTGFCASRALLSVGMFVLVAAGIVNFQSFKFKNFKQQKPLLAITFLFLSVAISGFWSSDKTVWWNFTRIHLPFLLLAIAFTSINHFSKKQFEVLLWVYTFVFSMSAAIVLGNYFLHFKEINNFIITGGFVPVPYSHIRYSLMLVMGFFAALWLLQNAEILSQKTASILAIFFFVVVHVLSVRSAIFSLYMGLIVLLIFQFKKLGYKKTVALFLVIVICVGIIFQTIPSLKNKLRYMRYDLIEFTQNKNLDASDGMRIRSWKAGLEVATKQPFYGAGYGDIYAEMKKWYDDKFPETPEEQKKLPHNQFLWWWVALGWLGALLTFAALLFPLIHLWKHTDWFLKVFYIVLFASFLWEPTLEEQMGTGFCIVWLFMLIHYKSAPNNG